jgi:hypothetical protein
VSAGQPVPGLRADGEAAFAPALAALEGAIKVGPQPLPHLDPVIERLGMGE